MQRQFTRSAADRLKWPGYGASLPPILKSADGETVFPLFCSPAQSLIAQNERARLKPLSETGLLQMKFSGGNVRQRF